MSDDPRVRIAQLTAPTLAALASGDLDAACALSRLPLTAYLVGAERIGVWRRRAVQVVATPSDLPWVTGVVLDRACGTVVGAAGFHAAPDAAGMVEVGYGIDPSCRRRGFARAALTVMLDRATSDPAVRTVRASVSPDNHASLGLVGSLPFVEVGEQWDDEDGLETVYEMAWAG